VFPKKGKKVEKKVEKKKEEKQELRLLKNLKEDLHTLETSWQSKNLKPGKVAKHFAEIMSTISGIARAESIESAEDVCADLREYLKAVSDGKFHLGERSWATASELIDLLCESLKGGEAPSDALEQLQARWAEEAQTCSGPAQDTESLDENEFLNLEDGEMSGIESGDAQQLLQQAQEALLSGNGENAKSMALKAARIIEQAEAAERKKREMALRTDLENTLRQESEIEQLVGHTKEEVDEREEELSKFTERLSAAQSALDERDTECEHVKKEIEKIESEIEVVQERHKKLIDTLEDALPARDAAERECAKIKAEYGDLPAKIEELRDNLQNLEHRSEQVGAKRAETEAELDEIAVKAPA